MFVRRRLHRQSIGCGPGLYGNRHHAGLKHFTLSHWSVLLLRLTTSHLRGACGVSYNADVDMGRVTRLLAYSPSQKVAINIRTPDSCCLISSCKIPANSL